MSGGSFNYLCHQDSPGREMVGKMAEAIRSYGDENHSPARHAAEDTLRIIALLEEVDVWKERLRDVWKAVEWHRSGDWGVEDVWEAILKHEKERAKHMTKDHTCCAGEWPS